jgi:NAD(P)H-hydrate epimerase
LPADEMFSQNDVALKADYTLSFQCWKRSFLHPETGKYTGKTVILDIDLANEYSEIVETKYFVIDDIDAEHIFKPRPEFSHKGNYGKAAIVGGSYGKIGAAVLATRSALKTGAGLTFTLAPKCGYEIIQTSCPEAMFIKGGDDFVTDFEYDSGFTYGIGPGLGTDVDTEKVF